MAAWSEHDRRELRRARSREVSGLSQVGGPARPAKAGDPLNHHYIPRFWLAGFAEPATKSGFLGVLDASATNTRAAVDNAASEESFYTVINTAGRPTLAIEESLSSLESDAAPPFAQLGESIFPTSWLRRFDIARLLTVQHLRRRTRVQALQRNLGGGGGRTALLRLRHGKLPDAGQDDDVAVAHSDVLESIWGPAIWEYAFHIFRRRWVLLCASEDGCGFVLPEDPLTVLSEYGNDRHGPGDIGPADEVWVPINRHRLLVMHRRTDEADGICAKASPDLISAYNRFQVGQPRQTVFCSPKDATTVAKLAAT